MNFLLEVDVSKPIGDFNEKLLYGFALSTLARWRRFYA